MKESLTRAQVVPHLKVKVKKILLWLVPYDGESLIKNLIILKESLKLTWS